MLARSPRTGGGGDPRHDRGQRRRARRRPAHRRLDRGDGEIALEFELAAAPATGDEVVARRRRVGLPRSAGRRRARRQELDVHAHGDHLHFSLDERGRLADRPGLAAVQQAPRARRRRASRSRSRSARPSARRRPGARRRGTRRPACRRASPASRARARTRATATRARRRARARPDRVAAQTSIEPSLRWRSAFSLFGAPADRLAVPQRDPVHAFLVVAHEVERVVVEDRAVLEDLDERAAAMRGRGAQHLGRARLVGVDRSARRTSPRRRSRARAD